MAQHQVDTQVDLSFTDKSKATEGSEATSDDSLGTIANYSSNDNMDTALLADGYTQATLDKMTQNDKIYALRLADDSDTI